MNKSLIYYVLKGYYWVDDGSLTIITNDETFNNCHVNDVNTRCVYIKDKDNKIHRIESEDIIGIQFADHMALVGMK